MHVYAFWQADGKSECKKSLAIWSLSSRVRSCCESPKKREIPDRNVAKSLSLWYPWRRGVNLLPASRELLFLVLYLQMRFISVDRFAFHVSLSSSSQHLDPSQKRAFVHLCL